MDNKKRIIESLCWNLMERAGSQLIQFIIQVVLARLLMPDQFGMALIAIVFISLGNVFLQNGLNTAVIQKKEANHIDYSTAFTFNMLIAGFLIGIIYVISPFVATFFEHEELTSIMRVLSLTFLFVAYSSIQLAILTKKMQFKTQFICVFIASISSGIVSILMAYNEFGVWSLVAQNVVSSFLMVVLLSYGLRWRPSLMISKANAKQLIGFGWKLWVSSIIDAIYNQSRTLIIGKIYDSKTLAYYNRGEQLPNLIINNLNGAVQSVMFPTLVNNQNDLEKVKFITRIIIKLSTFIVFPIIAFLVVLAENMTLILFTEKWLPMVQFIQIISLYYAFWPLHTTNLQAINAIGRSDIFLKLEIIKKIIGFTILMISLKYGVIGIAWGLVINGFIAVFINVFPLKNLIGYSFWEQFKDIKSNILATITMFSAMYIVNYIELNIYLESLVQILTGLVIYLLICKTFKVDSYIKFESILKDKLKTMRS